MTKRVFIDTSAWVAYLLKGEKNHKRISAYLNNLIKSRAELFTSDFVLSETWTRLITSQGFYYASALRSKTKQAESENLLTIFHTRESFFEETWDIFEKFSDKKLSYTDANIILYLRKFKVDEILTLDGDFTKAGFKTYPDLGQP